MSTATSTLQSSGALLFAPGPDGGTVLFVADVSAAAVRAFELPTEAAAEVAPVNLEELDAKLASLLGVEKQDVVVRGIAVHPVSHAVYLSVARGRGGAAGPAIVKATADGALEVVELDYLPVTSFTLDDAPAKDSDKLDAWLDGSDEGTQTAEYGGIQIQAVRVPAYRSSITGLTFADGTLFIAGLSNDEFSSRLRQVAYPFESDATETSVEIFHVDHGKYETASPIRALTTFDNGSKILASYTCTPLVTFTTDDLRKGGLVRGHTVAELGPMNQPFSIVAYEKGGEEFLLVSNTRHPLLKIPASSIDAQPDLTLGVSDPEHSMGVPRENLAQPGITYLASLDRENVVAIQRTDDTLALVTLNADAL